MSGVSVTRTNTTRRVLTQSLNRAIARTTAGLKAACDHVLVEAKKLTPIDTLALRDTSRVRFAGMGISTVNFIIGFGPQGVEVREWSRGEERNVIRIPYNYAVWVHEDTFPPMNHPRGGQPDFLRLPLADHQGIRLVFNDGAGL